MISPIVVFLIYCISTIHGQKLHEHLTKEEIQSVFNVQHDAIHEVEYEVVPIFHKAKEESNGSKLRKSNPTVHLRAFDQNYTLYLEINEHILLGNNTPIFIAKQNSLRRSSDESSIVYSRIKYPLPENFKLYHDLERRAAVTIHRETDDKVHIDGIIGDDVVIRPLPIRVHEEVLGKYPSLLRRPFTYKQFDPFVNDPFSDDPFSSNSYQATHHVVIRPNNQVNSPFYGSIGDRWNQIKQQWLHGDDSDESVDPFVSWQNTHRQPITLPPRNPFTWRPATREPFTWRPFVTKEPYTWRPLVTRDPWRPASRQPATGHYITKAPPTARLPTKNPITSRPTFKPTGSSTAQSDTVYPELLVTVDHETYTTHGSDIQTLSKYMAAFWNAVDLRFREINRPNIRLNIAGLIVPEQPNGASYMERNRIGSKTLLAEETLTEVGNYFAKEKKFSQNTYDIVVAISHRNLGDINRGKLNDGITGIATFQGACETKYGQSVALVRDKGGFNGITTAAHELAHTLGAPHDGPESSKVPGGPCPWKDGYLMSYERKNSRGMHWSQCSITAMRNFLRDNRSKCLKNKPDAGIPYPKVLPGRILTRDDQCERSLKMKSYKEKESDCAVLWCAKYNERSISYTTEYRPPAEGSYCGKGLICLNAECVKDPEESS